MLSRPSMALQEDFGGVYKHWALKTARWNGDVSVETVVHIL